MNFTDWNESTYYTLYDELVQLLDPTFELPVNTETGSDINWTSDFMSKKANSYGPQVNLKQAALSSGNDGGLTGSGTDETISEADRAFMMRYMQLKYSVLYLQKYRYLGKYCFYGCWCLPNGVGDIGSGQGQPVDNIDRSCREYATCYQCMYNQQVGGECSDDEQETRYEIKGHQVRFRNIIISGFNISIGFKCQISLTQIHSSRSINTMQAVLIVYI